MSDARAVDTFLHDPFVESLLRLAALERERPDVRRRMNFRLENITADLPSEGEVKPEAEKL